MAKMTDPVVPAIASANAAWNAFANALKRSPHLHAGLPGFAGSEVDRTGTAAEAALDGVLAAEPHTVPGLVALVEFAEARRRDGDGEIAERVLPVIADACRTLLVSTR